MFIIPNEFPNNINPIPSPLGIVANSIIVPTTNSDIPEYAAAAPT